MNTTSFLLLVSVLVIATVVYVRWPKQAITVPVGARDGDVFLEPCNFKTKTGSYKADCGTLVVSENRLKANSRMLALPVISIRAGSSSPRAPIFYLGGGPGVSNLRFMPPAELLAGHDIVMVGYRGVDGSSKLNCPEFSRAVLGDGNDLLGDGSLTGMTASIRACFARLQSAGVDISGYTIQQVVGDLEAARSALGYEKINLLSESYGTRVAQLYAGLHHDRMARSAMIGVNPPGRFVWEAQMIDEQIEYYSRLWANDSVAQERTKNLAMTMYKVSHNMPRRWLLFPMDAGKVNAVAFVLLFH